jgi:protoheme IX farnesyltransferase
MKHAPVSTACAGSLRGVLDAAADWLELTKPRIASMVFLSAFVGALLAAGPDASLGVVFEAALWVSCVAASSAVFNHVLERDTDRLMERTKNRPLPTGRLRARDAIFLGVALATAGVAGLALSFNLLSALLALATLVAYALVYTPLKRVSTLNTIFGAIPGAMPPLLGWVAVADTPASWGVFLFALLFCWQFPHFMAIAWLYRGDYARAGMKMLPAMPGGQGMAGRQALLYCLALLPVSLLPAVNGAAGWLFSVGVLLVGLAYVGASLAFCLRENRGRARFLLVVSLAYLPLVFSFILLDPTVRTAAPIRIP